MSITPISDAAEISIQLGNKKTGTGTVPIDVARRLEEVIAGGHCVRGDDGFSPCERMRQQITDLTTVLREIESDEALYATYFKSTATAPMGRQEWDRRNAWLTKARALLAKVEGK